MSGGALTTPGGPRSLSLSLSSSAASLRPTRSCAPSRNPHVETRHCRCSARISLMVVTRRRRVKFDTVGVVLELKRGWLGRVWVIDGERPVNPHERCTRRERPRAIHRHGQFPVMKVDLKRVSALSYRLFAQTTLAFSKLTRGRGKSLLTRTISSLRLSHSLVPSALTDRLLPRRLWLPIRLGPTLDSEEWVSFSS